MGWTSGFTSKEEISDYVLMHEVPKSYTLQHEKKSKEGIWLLFTENEIPKIIFIKIHTNDKNNFAYKMISEDAGIIAVNPPAALIKKAIKLGHEDKITDTAKKFRQEVLDGENRKATLKHAEKKLTPGIIVTYGKKEYTLICRNSRGWSVSHEGKHLYMNGRQVLDALEESGEYLISSLLKPKSQERDGIDREAKQFKVVEPSLIIPMLF